MSFPTPPRPILKTRVPSRSPTRYINIPSSLDMDPFSLRKTVQFSPGKQTFPAHSPDVYDRSPIKVSFNTCEIPDRDTKGSPSRRRGRRQSQGGPEGLFPASPTRALNMQELVQTLPACEEEDGEMGISSLRFKRPNTPIPSFGKLSHKNEDELIIPGRAHLPLLPSLVPDSSESEESDITSPPLESSEFSWTTSKNALETALTLRDRRFGSSGETSGRSVKYPGQLSLSNTSQPAAFQKRSRLNAQRHKIPFELTRTPSHESDVFDDTSGVMCEDWVVSAPDDESCLDGF